MPRNSFERRLERLVTGTFAKAFRSDLQPVEVGRRLIRELENSTQVSVRGTVAPNQFAVRLSADDAEHFASFQESFVRELEDAARDHVIEFSYRFIGPVTVTLVVDPAQRKGNFSVDAVIVDGGDAWRSAVRLPDGSRVPLTDDVTKIGRMPDCLVQLTDPKSSRYHAEIRSGRDGYRLHDLGSTNGTLLNGTVVTEARLNDGDEIKIGESVVRYEES